MSARVLAGLGFALVVAGCAPEIGRSCESPLDCSAQASRECDRTQHNGYCTIRGCEPDTCPEEAVCVKFRASKERLALTYCMLECEGPSDCRTDEGYTCTGREDFVSEDDQEDVVVLDGKNKRFCSFDPDK